MNAPAPSTQFVPTCVLCAEHLPAGHGVNIDFEAGRGGRVCCPQCHVMFTDLVGVLNTSWPAFAAKHGAGAHRRAEPPDTSS